MPELASVCLRVVRANAFTWHDVHGLSVWGCRQFAPAVGLRHVDFVNVEAELYGQYLHVAQVADRCGARVVFEKVNAALLVGACGTNSNFEFFDAAPIPGSRADYHGAEWLLFGAAARVDERGATPLRMVVSGVLADGTVDPEDGFVCGKRLW